MRSGRSAPSYPFGLKIGRGLRMIFCRVCSPFRMSLPSPILYATDWSPAASYQTLDGTGRSLVASKVGGADMSTVTASIPTAYALSEREAINPWIIAVTVTLATFMELLDTAIANVALPHIAGGLALSYDESTWVLTSYLVSNAVVLPLSAGLSRVFGRT